MIYDILNKSNTKTVTILKTNFSDYKKKCLPYEMIKKWEKKKGKNEMVYLLSKIKINDNV
jgi:hypothetical protein